MKIALSLLLVLAVGGAAAQQEPLNQTIKTELAKHGNKSVLVLRSNKPNEIQGSRVVYSGLSVEVVKTRNPLQLINPYAPGYGAGDDNVQIDPISGKPAGLRFFSIRF